MGFLDKPVCGADRLTLLTFAAVGVALIVLVGSLGLHLHVAEAESRFEDACWKRGGVVYFGRPGNHLCIRPDVVIEVR